MTNSPSYEDVLRAENRLKGIVRKTPLITNDQLNSTTGASVFIKPENLQVTGSFKFRGAYNAISALDETSRKMGVVACSSGNHAQGIAEAARLLGVKAVIIMPTDSPQIKLDRTRRSGAKIITYNRENEDRDTIARAVCDKTGARFIHPYNNCDVIAGQGTCGLEICLQLEELDAQPDRVLVCTGGGGLITGVTLALSKRFPDAKIHSVEPENFNDYQRSLAQGKILRNPANTGSICDALLTAQPGEIAFSVLKDRLARGLVVSDEQALHSVRFAFHELKLVLEPGGAVALAALLAAGKKWAGETIVCITTGGNIDLQMMTKALTDQDW